MALPEVPHWSVVTLVVLASAWWARSPDHLAGAVALVVVAAWWAAHDVVDWRILVVGVLLLGAHVVATLAAYGPATLAVDPRLASLWLRRGLLALVPMPVAYVAVRELDPRLAPPWVWIGCCRGGRRAARRDLATDPAGGRVSTSAQERELYAELVLQCAESVPRGRATTYGAIADVVGQRLGRGGPRLVGSVLAQHGGGVPWWRVVRADGSLPPSHDDEARQAYLEEGTPLRPSGAVDLGRAFWQPSLRAQ